MTPSALENYLLRFSKTKNPVEKASIIDEIKSLITNETPEEKKEGIESIKNAVENIAQKLDSKLVLQH
jgi:hypothetical protein